ncbi:hypothetical protein KI429_01980 [Pseudomonas shirazica]|nr:hypothetical protein KI429_01980 [Pseudomonas shirazica]
MVGIRCRPCAKWFAVFFCVLLPRGRIFRARTLSQKTVQSRGCWQVGSARGRDVVSEADVAFWLKGYVACTGPFAAQGCSYRGAPYLVGAALCCEGAGAGNRRTTR